MVASARTLRKRLKGESNQKVFTGPTDRKGKNWGVRDIEFKFLTRILALFVCWKSRFENRKNTTLSAAIFCPAVCISDVINRAGMCGKCVRYIIIRHEPAFFCLLLSFTTTAKSREPESQSKNNSRFDQNNQMKQEAGNSIFVHCLRLQDNLRLCFRSLSNPRNTALSRLLSRIPSLRTKTMKHPFCRFSLLGERENWLSDSTRRRTTVQNPRPPSSRIRSPLPQCKRGKTF